MFNSIAPRYDVLNRMLSGGVDQQWRRVVMKEVLDSQPQRLLDVATGTADLALMAARKGVPQVIGVDIADQMLDVGRRKVSKADLDGRVELLNGDAEKLPFSDKQFDVATVAFGVRNFEDLAAGLHQIHRVLRPGGKLVVLEFSRPRVFPVKQLYAFYNRFILPAVGKLVSGDSGAYTYLPESIAVFPEGDEFLNWMEEAGFTQRKARRLTFGIASVYVGHRAAASAK
ncbi:MAG: bifunctional demethylmenaquinone methyltransferase/2-methoxy-6-polyprenyl-1,4-benzoquinol methylase UbiE [Bacteroidetes bacterium]|nr:bifunctional demethylmenaquinone methyltransferase/2-methoxy-6-polyprenyl-1,4-benzoquinol methylase UbiE [Bacteroidota bacterium]